VGNEHSIKNAQNFQFALTDGGTSAVKYAIKDAQTVTTDDGYTIHFRPERDIHGTQRYIGLLADTMNDTSTEGIAGELVVECPVTGLIQRWRPAKLKIDDIDAPTLLKTSRFEDQFGNVMEIPDSGSGITVGAA